MTEIDKLSLILWISWLLSSFATCKKGDEKSYGLKDFDFSKANFIKLGEGGFGIVFAHEKWQKLIFKLIDINLLCQKHKKQFKSPKICAASIKAEIEKEIKINEQLKFFYDLSGPSFQFSSYLTMFQEFLHDGKSKYVMIFERLWKDLQKVQFHNFLKQSSLTKRFLSYQNIIRAVAVLHLIGFNHCDIKPENLILSKELKSAADLPPVIKLIDMGKATQNKFCSVGTSQFADPVIKGDWPKQKVTSVEATRHADIYSLGCTLLAFETCMIGACMNSLKEGLSNYRTYISKLPKGAKKDQMEFFFNTLLKMVATGKKEVNMLQIMIKAEMIIEKLAKIEKENISKYQQNKQWLADIKDSLSKAQKYEPENFPKVTMQKPKNEVNKKQAQNIKANKQPNQNQNKHNNKPGLKKLSGKNLLAAKNPKGNLQKPLMNEPRKARKILIVL